MKGKRTFWTSIVAGACIGGLLSLLNKDARDYSKKMLQHTGEAVRYYSTNPDVTVEKVKNAVESISNLVNENTGSALNAIEQVENTVNKLKN